MEMKKKARNKHRFGENTEAAITAMISHEFTMGLSNQEAVNTQFRSAVDMLSPERRKKNYSWQSNLHIPEFTSIILTQAAIDAGQYFKDRDFVEVYTEDPSDEAQKAAEAEKELLNRTLNRRTLHYFQKFTRCKTTNNIGGRVYVEGWWNQELKTIQIGEEERVKVLDVDIFGNPIEDFENQTPATGLSTVPVFKEAPVVDEFDFDLVDQRNVITDNSYVYSLQDKRYVIIYKEVTLSELHEIAEREGYFNLDLINKTSGTHTTNKTEAADRTYNEEDNHEQIFVKGNEALNKYKRYGKYWCLVERDEFGEPYRDERGWIKVKPGVDNDGNPLPGAELQETIITVISGGGADLLIGFYITPYVDARGRPYRPIIRGICYVHPTQDGGMGDGPLALDLQTGLDDTLNVSNDRVMLATMPTLKGRKYSLDDADPFIMQPGYVNYMEDPDRDLKEILIRDNISGALQQAQVYSNKIQQLTATYPTTMGDVPSISSTTATAVAEAGTRSDTRNNYKALSFEHTFLCELYWMISQMTYQFAQEETARNLMGDKIVDFNPTLNYTYKPISQAIETEASKFNKLKIYQMILGYIAQMGHPNAVGMVNYLLTKMFSLLGDDLVNFGNKLLNEKVPIAQKGQETPVTDMGGGGPSNQTGLEQPGAEVFARENAGMGMPNVV